LKNICSACGTKADKAYRLCLLCGAAMKGSREDQGWIDEIEAPDVIFDD